MIPVPSGVVPIRVLTAGEVLYGSRKTSYRWEVLTHSGGVDSLAGILDGVVDESAWLAWETYNAVKGSGGLRVLDLAVAQPGYLKLSDLNLVSVRLRPVLVIDGLPEIPFGVFLITSAPEEWSGTGRVVSLELLDRATVLDQDKVDVSFTVDSVTPILSAVASVVASAGEQISVDAAVVTKLANAMVWDVGTSKLQIVNDLLKALNYSSLWVDGVGSLKATPYQLPADRSMTYELLNFTRELVDGERSIYADSWTRDLDFFNVPNKVVAVQSGSGGKAALAGVYSNTDAGSPFSYPARGRWITRVLENVDAPEGIDAVVVAFLEAKARASLVAASSVQSQVEVKHLPVPLRVSDVLRFANAPAGIDARHVVMSVRLDAHPLGLMSSKLQEVVSL